ncbi:alpha/beta hydrolase fold domain-containing protein [Nocardia sp. NBC_00416]|uniref:alpha/beta hydrolase fold domain-containing protein n=1 Tax=Nocardia sp. NBC_00416 TaxID=2975991 RepID=UPI002E1C2F42
MSDTSPARAHRRRITSEDGAEVQLLVHEPAGPARGWLVWAHGGSWQHGSTVRWASITAQLCALSGWTVVSVDYRLAPAHRFPTAVFDVSAALDWAEREAADLPVAVGGDSAGGTIAAVAALARRDTGGRVPPQVLAYPPLDPDCARPSYQASPDAFPNRSDLRAAWRLWLGTGTHHPLIHPTPLAAASLAGLAAVSLVVGDDDPVRDDVTCYAERLDADAVPTRLRTLPGVGHSDLFRPRSRALRAVATMLAEPTPTGLRPNPGKGTSS